MLVAAGEGEAAVGYVGQVDDGCVVGGGDGHDGAQQAETRDAAVGEHVEAHVRDGAVGAGQLPDVALAGPARLARQQRAPGCGVVRSAAIHQHALDRHCGRVVAIEVRRVHLDAVHHAGGHAQLPSTVTTPCSPEGWDG